MSLTFADRLIRWQREYGRHALPWQNTCDPYAIWMSEVMLQQTQVTTVIPYYKRFMVVFPEVASLARASVEEVLALWSGLGYYARGRNLHRAASIIMEQHGGVFPRDREALQQLPGIGRSTAAAIAAFAFGERCTILDGNVKRILARYFGISGHPGERVVEEQLWKAAENLLPRRGGRKTMATYTQALMDLGALVCLRARPRCRQCPLQIDCIAHRNDLTAALPAPKPGKLLPARQAVHLILVDDRNRILLERRPASGIWGGLWCFPEIPVDQDSMDYCQQNLKLEVIKFAELPCLYHTFTHFKLAIYPQLMQLITYHPVCEENNHIWVTIDEAMRRAIPVPVRKLLSTATTILRPSDDE